MKKNLFILLILLLISCTDTNEETNENFYINLKNESSNTLIFEGWKASEILIDETIFDGALYTTSYNSVNFLGFFGKIDSLAIKFENNKGYICTGELSDNLCFEDRNTFNVEDYDNLGNNTYEFVITQDDFDNAFDLP